MGSRRIACLLLGLWMGAALWMLWVSSNNAAAADRLLLAPSASAAAYLKTLGRAPTQPAGALLWRRAESRAVRRLGAWCRSPWPRAVLLLPAVRHQAGQTSPGDWRCSCCLSSSASGWRRSRDGNGRARHGFQPQPLPPCPTRRRDVMNYGYAMAEWTKFALAAAIGRMPDLAAEPALTRLPAAARSGR